MSTRVAAGMASGPTPRYSATGPCEHSTFKLGTVVGVPSWGGLVGIINGQPTLDNGTVHQSNNAFNGKDGRWLVENHGTDPTS